MTPTTTFTPFRFRQMLIDLPDAIQNQPLAAYHAAKHGIIDLTKTAALEYAARCIGINALCPGEIESGLRFNFGAYCVATGFHFSLNLLRALA